MKYRYTQMLADGTEQVDIFEVDIVTIENVFAAQAALNKSNMVTATTEVVDEND